MQNHLVSLFDMIKLSHNGALSEKYIEYLCGLDSEKSYHHQEILDISTLLPLLGITDNEASGFIYGYTVPQLSKEFDLLKISEECCLNIELKSQDVGADKIEKQLKQNLHYLKILNRQSVFLFTFVSATKKIYTLHGDKLKECDFNTLKSHIQKITSINIDLDAHFTPNNILVSPLNSPERFLEGNYLLTENQSTIKKNIIDYISSIKTERFIGLTGGPGTGKTLLIYDIAKELQQSYKILLVHSGILCQGHDYLNNRFKNIKIISARDLRLREIKDVDIVIVDEAHRLYESLLEKIHRWVTKTKTICIFSYDVGQKLSNMENRMRTSDDIETLCTGHVFKLTNKIRTNKELALFISCLRDLSKYRPEYRFNHVHIYFEPDKNAAIKLAKQLSMRESFTYITYTSSFYDHRLDYQKSDMNTHTVIGQEFDNVCMIIDDNFYYDNNRLKGKTHPNPDYIFEKLLYQGLTRVRSKLAIIITEEALLEKILPLVNKSIF